jgi:asparagine synthetase B (glutamine-hydrolysing)
VRLYSLGFEELASLDETRYSRAVAERTGLPHTILNADECWSLSDLDDVLGHMTEPFMGASDAAIRMMLSRASLEGARRVVFGHGGDHLLTGSRRYAAEWLCGGSWRALHRELRMASAAASGRYARRFIGSAVLPLAPPGFQRLASRVVHGAESPKNWIRDSVRRSSDEVVAPLKPRRGPRAWWYELRDAIAGFGQLPLAAHDLVLRSFDLEQAQPFLDVPLAELVLRSPPDALFRSGQTKVLLREALHDLLPAEVRERPDKAVMTPLLHRGLRERRRKLVRSLLVDSELERRGYVVASVWRQMVERYLDGEDRLAGDSWRSLSTEIWLRAEEGRLPSPLEEAQGASEPVGT